MVQILLIIAIVILRPLAAREYEIQKRYKEILIGDIVLNTEFVCKRTGLQRKGYNTEGVYIFTNLSKGNQKYVGQSIDMLNRVNAHLIGRGNKDLYSDIQRGDEFTIELIKLKESEFTQLDMLEKYWITKNNSYYNGYNKTRGNSN